MALRFALGAAVCAVLAWLALRRPTVLLWLVVATLCIGPQWVFADSAGPALLTWAMPAQMLLLLAALLANAARYGVRLDLVNWPLRLRSCLLPTGAPPPVSQAVQVLGTPGDAANHIMPEQRGAPCK